MENIKRGPLHLAVLLAMLPAGALAYGASNLRYLHVRVSNPATHELVRVNVPLILAEKVIPAVNQGELRDGKVRIGCFTANNVNLRAILDALRTAPEGEFVSIQQTENDVRVAKEHGQMVVRIIDKQSSEKVDITIPWEVAQALVSDTGEDQLNVEAAIKALENVGDTTLVRVNGHEDVRIWVDSRNTDESGDPRF
jgi:ribonuclease HI